jgi:uracil-DNA glycosylase
MAGKSAVKNLNTIIERLNKKHPDARYELNYESPFQLLIATILAAQATDVRINQVTPGLFAKYPTAKHFADADRTELEQDLKPTGFYRNKARAVQECCQALVANFGGEVSQRLEDLITLPGVARKTANVVVNNAFRIPSGIIVDTHVARVSQRLGLSEQTRPEKIEQDLMKIVPKDEWVQFGPAMVLLGRYTCTAARPNCGECVMNDLCPKNGVEETAEATPAKSTNKKKVASEAKPMGLAALLPEDWRTILTAEFGKPYFRKLEEFVATERKEQSVFPPEEDVFNAFKHTAFASVKVLLLGQDPYHDDGQAQGLCFSVRPGVKAPPSLVNIFKELHDDLGCTIPDHGSLLAWADRGVMLLNAVLTVRAHSAASHKEQGWETFTDAVISALSARPEPVVFLLWGAYAQKKAALIDANRHVILNAAHPSPLSSKKFFGSKPFSQANAALKKRGCEPIDWQIPPLNRLDKPTSSPASAPPAVKPTPVAAVAENKPTAAASSTPAAPNPVAGIVQSVLSHLHSLRHAALLPEDWCQALAPEFDKPYFRKLEKFLDAERQTHSMAPSENDVFRAFTLTPFAGVRAVLVADEPSPRKGYAQGLACSVPEGTAPTPTLSNMFRELRTDLGCWIPSTGDLTPWARQGVLLLNSVLTVRIGEPGSHRDRGWENFTDAVIQALSRREKPVVFLLMGAAGQRKGRWIDTERDAVIRTPEPTSREFLGTQPFSAVNNALELNGHPAVYWQLPAL